MKKPQNQALLVMDMQMGLLQMFPGAASILENVSDAIGIARSNNIPVIYVVVGFRNGIPEISSRSARTFANGKEHFSTLNMDQFMQVIAQLAPTSSDVIVVKRRVSAFSGSDLDVVLRSLGITHLVLCGVVTSGVILSTLREAADKDFGLTVLSNCCLDRDADVHKLLMEKVFPHQADVVSVREWPN
jgi:nicotinamidase-related amidase